MEKFKEYLKSILIALVLSLVVRVAIVEGYLIPSGSMLPTIAENDRILSNKFIYRFTDPDPGDIVVFNPPEWAHTNAPRFVKRVIGIEGDWIKIKNGIVYRNGNPLSEPYIKQQPDYTLPEFRVPEGYLFSSVITEETATTAMSGAFFPERTSSPRPCSATGHQQE